MTIHAFVLLPLTKTNVVVQCLSTKKKKEEEQGHYY